MFSSPTSSVRNRSKTLLLISVLVGLGMALIITLAVLFTNGQNLLSYSFQFNLGWLFLSFIVECSGLFLAVLVWHQILSSFGCRMRYQDDFRLYSYSMLAITVPGGFWPLIGRTVLYERQGVSSIKVAIASVVEFVLIGLAGLVVFGLTMFVSPAETGWQHPGIALTMTLSAILLLQPPIFHRFVGWLLHRTGNTEELLNLPGYLDLGKWLVMEAFVVVIGGAAVYVLLHSVAVTTISIHRFFFMVNAWAVATVTGNLFFWLPGTPIIRDGAMALVLTQSLPATLAVVFVLLIRVWTIASIMIVVVLTWLLLGRD